MLIILSTSHPQLSKGKSYFSILAKLVKNVLVLRNLIVFKIYKYPEKALSLKSSLRKIP